MMKQLDYNELAKYREAGLSVLGDMLENTLNVVSTTFELALKDPKKIPGYISDFNKGNLQYGKNVQKYAENGNKATPENITCLSGLYRRMVNKICRKAAKGYK